MVEARTRIASGGKQREILSPLDVVGCSPYSQGCNGGFPYLVGKYGIDFGYAARNSGAILAQFCEVGVEAAQFWRRHRPLRYVSEACVPYNLSALPADADDIKRLLRRDLPCAALPRCPSPRRRHARDVRYVGGFYGNASEEAMLRELANNGPVPSGSDSAHLRTSGAILCAISMRAPILPLQVAVGIYADAELMLYESGIFRALDRDFWRRTAGRTHPSYDPLTCHSGCAPPPKLDWQQVNHAVLLVGYGREQPAEEGGAEVPYWILANTWGGGWGEGGFFRVMRGVDEAAVESLAVAVDPRV